MEVRDPVSDLEGREAVVVGFHLSFEDDEDDENEEDEEEDKEDDENEDENCQ